MAPKNEGQWTVAENRYKRKWRRSQLRKAAWKAKLDRRRVSIKQGYGTPRFVQAESSSDFEENVDGETVRRPSFRPSLPSRHFPFSSIGPLLSFRATRISIGT